MKKVLSIVLAIIMAITALAPITAFADVGDVASYNVLRGKKAGEVYGSIQGVRNVLKRKPLSGFDEIMTLLEQAESQFEIGVSYIEEASLAYVEVEKDNVEIAVMRTESNGDGSGIILGYGYSAGDPSGCSRDINVIHAEAKAAIANAKEAMTASDKPYPGSEDPKPLNFKTAEYAVLELFDAEETLYKTNDASGGNLELAYKHQSVFLETYERAKALEEKTKADVLKNQEALEAAQSKFNSVIALVDSAREKGNALEVANADGEDSRLYQEAQFYLDQMRGELDDYSDLSTLKKAEGNLSAFEDIYDDLEELSLISIMKARAFLPQTVLPKFFMVANNLTYNGKEQALVTLGTDVYVPEGEQILFALGEAADKTMFEPDYSDFGTNAPADEAFSAAIPTAKEPGTYYVYAKFPGYVKMVAKAVIKEAAPAPNPEPVKPTVPEKEANTLKAKGKKVKVSAAKLEKKKVTVKRKKAISVKSAQGTVSYKKTKGNKKIFVAKNGKIIIKKGLKAGTYKIRIKVTAAGNKSYKKGSQTVVVKVVVK